MRQMRQKSSVSSVSSVSQKRQKSQKRQTLRGSFEFRHDSLNQNDMNSLSGLFHTHSNMIPRDPTRHFSSTKFNMTKRRSLRGLSFPSVIHSNHNGLPGSPPGKEKAVWPSELATYLADWKTHRWMDGWMVELVAAVVERRRMGNRSVPHSCRVLGRSGNRKIPAPTGPQWFDLEGMAVKISNSR